MLPHPDSFTSKANQLFQSEEWIWLFEFTNPDGGPLIGPDTLAAVPRLTAHTAPVVWGVDSLGQPLRWDPWPIKFQELPQDSQGNITEFVVTFSNALGIANQLLHDNAMLRNHRVTMTLVHSASLGNPAAKVAIKATVIHTVASWDAVTLTLSAFGFMDLTVPQALCTRLCRHQYRKGGCGFIGDPDGSALGNCALTLEACRLRGAYEAANGLQVLHPRRFGGFPSLPYGPLALANI